MRLVKPAAEHIRPGDFVTTQNWSPSSDGARFRVLERFKDGWLLCLSDGGKRRQFALEHVVKIEEGA